MKSRAITSGLARGSAALHGISLLTLVLTSNAIATDRSWTGGGDGTTMSAPANWGGTAPLANDQLFFGTTTGYSVNNDYTANTVFNAITFNSGAGAFTLSGNQVNLGGGVTNNSATAQAISLTLGMNSANRDVLTVGDLILATVSGSSGKPRIVKWGAGTLTLGGSADNSYGSTTVNAGLEVLAKASSSSVHALGGDVTVNTNGTLQIAGTGGDQIFNRTGLRIDGRLQVYSNETILVLWGTNGTGVVENGLAGTNVLTLQNYNNPRAIYNGRVQDGAAGVLEIDITGGGTGGGIAQQFDGTNTYTGPTKVYTTSAGISRLIMNGVHTGGGDYSVYGNAAANTAALCGKGIISASKLEVGAYGTLSPGGSIPNETGGSTFSETTAILTVSNAVNLTDATSTLDVQLNGTTAGTGYDQLNIAGPGTFSNNSANLKFKLNYVPAIGDKFTIVKVPGTSSANNIGTFSSLNGTATDLSQGATFVESTYGNTLQISYRAEGSTFDAGAGNGNDIMLQVINPIGGANLTWRGNGTDNSWDGTEWWNGTTLTTFNSGDFVTFDNTGSNNTPVNLASAVTPATLLINSTKDYVLSGVGKLTGQVIITKTNTGTLAITTDNDNTGATTVQGGTLQVGTNGTSGTLSGTVTVNANGVLAHKRSDDLTTAFSFAGSGGFVHSGSGALVLTANVPFTGRTTNSGGLLQLGDGSNTSGSIGGDVFVGPASNLRYYYYNGGVTIGNSLSGSGTVNYDLFFGNQTFTIPTTTGNSNFTGSSIIGAGVKLNVPNDGAAYALGNTGFAIATNSGSQISLGRNSTPYNQTFILSGTGWPGDTTPLGALRLYRNAVSGPIILAGDTRIKADGVVISGQISGAYTLEIASLSGAYPNDAVTLNPTSGANSYGNTLVTSGFVRVQNSGGLSPNGLAVDATARLNAEGCSLTVANLQNGASGGGFICNGSTATNGTLVVGTDNSSTAFDGLFGDGASKAFNLTKVGAGILTLSGVSTNTGTVEVDGGTLALTGSGSFNNASRILANATLDVSGIGGALTLSSGQTLGGSGTVAGAVVASANSTVSPGSSVGTLTVSGNVSLSGLLLMELNRTNAPLNCDRLVSSGGTITYGGNLLVTNIGPTLHVNDTFQVFSSGVTGFGANITVATTDATGYIYTWQNDIATLGSVKVLSVNAPVNPNPPHILSSVSANTLHLAWPTNAGWTLLTNSVGVTASGQWFPYPGSASLTSVDIPLDPTKSQVFFRMVYPYP